MSEFVDEAALCVRGGDGGAGAVSFRREAHVPRGGPDGGDGGTGGDLWLVADPQMASLLAFRDHPHRRATSGTHGAGGGRKGASGADLRVSVPVGTVVHESRREEREGSDEVLADLAGPGATWLAARAGRGGRGNASFLSNRRRAPSFAEQGEAGEERWLRLELKLMADVALVGLPNAGKSTLISRVSAARPKIAAYPFTTLVPNLGVVRAGGGGTGGGASGPSITEFVMADIPGLIEGAAEGRGLGHRFLRHIERARVLLMLIDLAPADEMPPEDQERVLLSELGRYRPELLDRPRLVVGTKADAAADHPWSGTRISAATGEGIAPLVHQLGSMVTEARDDGPAVEAYVVHRPEPEGIRVERADDGAFVVVGRSAERAVAVSDLTNPQALDHVHGRLRRLGVDRALVRAGAKEGDPVRVGRMSFEFQEDAVVIQGPRRGRRR